MSKEIWKGVLGFETAYQISNHGRVKSLNAYGHGGVGYLTPQANEQGYQRVQLHCDNHRRNCFVHVLVALAFIPNRKGKPQVNHIDEDKINNCVDNLEWMTNKENVNHGTGMRRSKEPLMRKVTQLSLHGKFIKEWESITSTSQIGCCSSCVVKCCKGKRKTHKGYRWRYA